MNLWEMADLSTPWSLHVAATLGIAGHIAAGKTEIADLAAAADVDRNSLYRVLRHLVNKGVFEEPAPGRFALNDPARQLMEGPIRLGLDLNGIGGRMAHAWGTLLTAVRRGRPAYHEIFGRAFWDDLEAHPDIAASFDELMGVAGHGVPDPEVLVDPSFWASVKTVVDVGGGTGALLAEVLRAHPQARGTLVDFPRTVARSPEVFAAAGVAERATAVGQSFFDPLPAGADLYILKGVINDWPDPEAIAILKRCAEALPPAGRVSIIGGVGPDEPESPELMMMVLVGGRRRPLAEFRAMAREAGLAVRASGNQPTGRFMVELAAE
jgi:hypothetical protein